MLTAKRNCDGHPAWCSLTLSGITSMTLRQINYRKYNPNKANAPNSKWHQLVVRNRIKCSEPELGSKDHYAKCNCAQKEAPTTNPPPQIANPWNQQEQPNQLG